MDDDAEYEKGLKTAYRLLAARARSEHELRTRLKQKPVRERTVDRIVARLYEQGYLDDEAFARQWARHLALDKLSGNRRIEMKLREKGVDRALCGRVIEEVRREAPEAQAIRRIMREKASGGKPPGRDGRSRQALVRHLLGRGFAPDVIYDMMRETKEEHRDDDGQSD